MINQSDKCRFLTAKGYKLNRRMCESGSNKSNEKSMEYKRYNLTSLY